MYSILYKKPWPFIFVREKFKKSFYWIQFPIKNILGQLKLLYTLDNTLPYKSPWKFNRVTMNVPLSLHLKKKEKQKYKT